MVSFLLVSCDTEFYGNSSFIIFWGYFEGYGSLFGCLAIFLGLKKCLLTNGKKFLILKLFFSKHFNKFKQNFQSIDIKGCGADHYYKKIS